MTFYIIAAIILAGLLIYAVFVKPPKRKGYVDIRVGDQIEFDFTLGDTGIGNITHIIYKDGNPVRFRLNYCVEIYWSEQYKNTYIDVNSTSYINLSALEREQKQREEILEDLV